MFELWVCVKVQRDDITDKTFLNKAKQLLTCIRCDGTHGRAY